VCGQGGHCPTGPSNAMIGEWGVLNKFLANKFCSTHQWNMLEPDLPVLWAPQQANKTLAETDRCWSGQGRACKTACNLSHHHHVPTKA
jgi:hypothetical protein